MWSVSQIKDDSDINMGSNDDGNGAPKALLPPPPVASDPDVNKKKMVRVPMRRRGLGTRGQKIQLLTNHFKVNVKNLDDHFYHYRVSFFHEDGQPVDAKGIGRKVLDIVQQAYGSSELADKQFAYDGENTLVTVGPLPLNTHEFTVVLEEVTWSRNNRNSSPSSPNETDKKRIRRPNQSKTFKVELNYAAKTPMQAIANALRGQDSDHSREVLQGLDIMLSQHAAKQGCLIVRQSFFHKDPKNFADIGGGVLGCRGFHSSFRTTQGGLSLNIDVSTAMIIRPGPVIHFLIDNQNVEDPFSVDWVKAKRTLKSLRVKISPTNREFKITGLSERNCREQTFTMKKKTKDGEPETMEVTVYDYFVKHRNIDLSYSALLPCINVGKPNRPTYFPVELCELVSLQRYTKALTSIQRASLMEKSRQKPLERMSVLTNALRISNYEADPLLRSCGVSISNNFTQIEGRVLPTPKLRVGNGEDVFPRNGRWNFNHKKLLKPVNIEQWAIVNFSVSCDIRNLIRDLTNCGRMKGIMVQPPMGVIEESHQLRRAPPLVRVDKMLDILPAKLPDRPKFLLCLLPESKTSNIYGPWKKRNLSDLGVVTQCMAPIRINDQYLTNLLLKINTKLGGLNSELHMERKLPMVSNTPTIIFGMDVSRGSPGQSDAPSIAAVVSSREWPLISRYRAAVRTQSPNLEMIDSLFDPVSQVDDNGIIRELLVDFYASCRRKPEQIIIFRDGVGESQFNQVLNKELDQIMEACKHLDESWSPKFLLIVAQKKHHTKFFQTGGVADNVPPGTIIDSMICHPKNNDFYLCSQLGAIGTTRPTHYHILYDEIGYGTDDLQELVHSLSYVYQRSTTAISVVAPIRYAQLAASQLGQWMKFEDSSETTSSRGVSHTQDDHVPPMPRINGSLSSSMFFC